MSELSRQLNEVSETGLRDETREKGKSLQFSKPRVAIRMDRLIVSQAVRWGYSQQQRDLSELTLRVERGEPLLTPPTQSSPSDSPLVLSDDSIEVLLEPIAAVYHPARLLSSRSVPSRRQISELDSYQAGHSTNQLVHSL